MHGMMHEASPSPSFFEQALTLRTVVSYVRRTGFPYLPTLTRTPFASRQVAALVSRLEKSVPKAAAKAETDLRASMKGLKIDKAPEPLREVLAAKTAEKGTINGGKPLNRNPSMHMGGYVNGDQRGTLSEGPARAASPPPAPTTLGTLPSFSLGSPVRSGAEEDALDVSAASSSVEGDEGKCAEEVLADVQASEEIFGKAFRGGPKAAAGLAARLQREVRIFPCRVISVFASWGFCLVDAFAWSSGGDSLNHWCGVPSDGFGFP